MRKNSKRIVASIAALGLISTGGVFAMPTVEEEVPVNISAEEIVEAPVVNGAVVDGVEAVMVGESLMIPLRAVAEGLGYQVNWNEENWSIDVIKGAQFITMAIDKDEYAFSRRAPQSLGAAPTLVDDCTTYVPISFISEILNGYYSENEDGTYKIVNPAIVSVSAVNEDGSILVTDSFLGEVLVKFDENTKFVDGEKEDIAVETVLGIEYGAAMTASIPPQTTAQVVRFENPVVVEEVEIETVAFEGEITAIEEELVTVLNGETEIVLVVSDETVITRGMDRRIYKIDDLEVGMKISGSHSEAMTYSIPPQSAAISINIEG